MAKTDLEFSTASGCGDGACVEVAIDYKKSSFCGDSACTELAVGETIVFMRNSTDPDTVVEFDRLAWQDLHAGITAGEFSV